MTDRQRRRFLKVATNIGATAAALSVFPDSIRRALALPASNVTGAISDVQHIVILMQENRSFDHYFGTLRGVRGFGDRHPVPLATGKPVWFQSDGERDVPPYHLDSKTTSALRVQDMPHTFSDAQAAWNQGRFGFWPKFKTQYSMGHYRREDIPFQFALAEAFTLCDAHHCSITTGTDPNRIAFFSGSNFDPEKRRRHENCTADDAEVNNFRCLVTGALPTPGYRYQGSSFNWPTIPELLERAGVTWRIYQNPNDNWSGLMHGGLAFAGFREAVRGSVLYQRGMCHASLEQLVHDVEAGLLPQVSWVLPPMVWSEHPAPSSPPQGAEFTSRVFDALTAKPEVWGGTVFFLTFDENDGLFDHVPPPAPPSYNADGSLAGGSTLDLRGQYFSDPERTYIHPDDQISGTVRPWGLGPRVPLYIVSPWSRGGWVNSQVFDHTSIGQFLERRFGITVPAISPWHRAVCGDLTSAFDFVNPNKEAFPDLPAARESGAVIEAATNLPGPVAPETPQPLFQESGIRRSRALPYELHVRSRTAPKSQRLVLEFQNTGRAGAVFHVYDRLHLDRIPRRYTVEAGESIADTWHLGTDGGNYDLWVYGPNGLVREFRGTLGRTAEPSPEVELAYDAVNLALHLIVRIQGPAEATLVVRANAYRLDGPWMLQIRSNSRVIQKWSLIASHQWYDFTVSGERFERRFAGRMETGNHSYSDPAM